MFQELDKANNADVLDIVIHAACKHERSDKDIGTNFVQIPSCKAR